MNMSDFFPTSEWSDCDPGDFSLLLKGLANVGWIKDDYYVDLKDCRYVFTEKGTKAIAKLSKIVRAYRPQFFGLRPRDPAPSDLAMMHKQFVIHQPSLAILNLTGRQRHVLLGFVGKYARDNPASSGK